MTITSLTLKVKTMSDFSFDFEKYKQVLAQRESSGNPKAINRLGYVGLYQLGAPALIDAGLVKPGTTNKGLRNKNNWLHGLSLSAFLKSPMLQDRALKDYTLQNHRALMSKGMISEDTDPTHIPALLAASHLVGATGAQQALVQGKDVMDKNNVKPQEYFQMMSSAFGGPKQPSVSQPETPPPQPEQSMMDSIGSGLRNPLERVTNWWKNVL